jgi:hypothetical protein
MQNKNQPACSRRVDFSSYLTGATSGCAKVAIEQHLCDCKDCFDAFVATFNQHLDHSEPARLRPHIGGAPNVRSYCCTEM